MESNGYIRKMTTYEKIDQRFASGNMTELTRYIDSLRFPIDIATSDGGYTVPPRDEDKTQLYQNSAIYADNGNGRVSKGLRGLELLSKLCKGVDPANLFLFNNVIYSSTPQAVKRANSVELIDIIISNLGMTILVQKAEARYPQSTEDFKALCLRIGIEVKAGTFRKEDYSAYALKLTKRIAMVAAKVGS